VFGLQGLPSDPPTETGLSLVDREPHHMSRRCSTTDNKTTSANPGLPESGTPHGDIPIQGADHDRCRRSVDGCVSHISRRSTPKRGLQPVRTFFTPSRPAASGPAGAAFRPRSCLSQSPRGPSGVPSRACPKRARAWTDPGGLTRAVTVSRLLLASKFRLVSRAMRSTPVDFPS